VAVYTGDFNYRGSKTPIAFVQRVTPLVRLITTLTDLTTGQSITPEQFNSDHQFAVSVVAVNSSGQVIPTQPGTVTMTVTQTPVGGSLNGPTSVPFSGGVAQFRPLSVTKQGKYVLVFTSGNLTTTLTLDDTGRQA
jgi:hypothetical protein